MKNDKTKNTDYGHLQYIIFLVSLLDIVVNEIAEACQSYCEIRGNIHEFLVSFKSYNVLFISVQSLNRNII